MSWGTDFTANVFIKNKLIKTKADAESDYSKRRINYWKQKAEMYERAYLAVTKRLNEINRKQHGI